MTILVAAAMVGAVSDSAAMTWSCGDEPVWLDRIEWGEQGPTAREHPSLMVYGGEVVVYAGSGYEPQGAPLDDAWAFDLQAHTWRKLEVAGDVPSPAGSRRVAQTPGADVAYLFGGYGANFATDNELYSATLKGDVLRFTRIEQVTPPPARALHAFGFDPKSGRLVVTHGVSTSGFLGDTWIGEFDSQGSVAWTEIEGTTQPSPRFGSAYGFDTGYGELVLLSGQLPGAEGNPMPMTQELWVLETRSEPPAWRLIEVDSPPVGRRNPMFAFDDAADQLAIWCGTADARSNVPGLVSVYRDEEGGWRLVEQSDENAPPRRSSGTGFADPSSDRLYFGFGNAREGRYTDWVTLELAAPEG